MAKISTNAEINSIRVKEQASAPSTPASGYLQIYAKDDGKLYYKNDDGTEVCLTTALENPMTTAGDIIYGGVDGAPTRLAAGTEDYVLTMGATNPEWAEASGGGGDVYTDQENVFTKQQKIEQEAANKNGLIIEAYSDYDKVNPLILAINPSDGEMGRLHFSSMQDIFLGAGAGENVDYNTYGAYSNILIGAAAGADAQAAYGNIALGNRSLGYLNDGSNNVGIGDDSIGRLVDSNNNIAIGMYALSKLEASSEPGGDDNVAVGYNAGSSTAGAADVENAAQCVYIGSGVVASADDISNEIAIGYGTEGKGSDTATLGNDSITDTYLKGTVHVDSEFELSTKQAYVAISNPPSQAEVEAIRDALINLGLMASS